jgi:hypothetical protein
MYRKCGTVLLIAVKGPIKRGPEMSPGQAQEHRRLGMQLQGLVAPQYEPPVAPDLLQMSIHIQT